VIRFLLKGLLRDRSRSLFPVLTVIIGTALTVVMYSWIRGTEADIIRANANFNTGHVRVMTRAYTAEIDRVPNDLALLGARELLGELQRRYPDFEWAPRIRFGGLLDIPDDRGQTRAQAPVTGLAVRLLGEDPLERRVLNLDNALVGGRLPAQPGEIVVSDELFTRLELRIGDTATLISSTMYGSMATTNFTVVGTIEFGVAALDRGAILADLEDVRQALDMQTAAGEILGLLTSEIYDERRSARVAADFNARVAGGDIEGIEGGGEFAPLMGTLREQSGLSTTLDLAGAVSFVLITIFVVVMSIVLWNAGLIGALRRYGEMGLRLALGEPKGHIYRTLILESLTIGVVGSIFGTALGVGCSWYLQEHGVNIEPFLKNASMMIFNVMRARVTTTSFFIGFVPGLLATILGTSISGLGIYRRQTSQLAKELEA
jgi:putative ABC transport system permease protein